MADTIADPRAQIRDRALALGFDAVGFAPADLGQTLRDELAEFIRQGHHGDMGWLADRAEQRGAPKSLWPAARSVVALGVNYGPESDPLELLEQKHRGGISVYARNRDYHDVIKKRLKALGRWMAETLGCEVKVFTDTAPVMEKPLAALAGIGWQGKHTNLVSREFGSWLFLGEVYCSLDLPADAPEADHCGQCRRCLDACPTGALPEPYRLLAGRCISYLTIEHKGPIPRDLRPLMGNRIYGCDDCLSVCPWNKFARRTVLPELAPRADLDGPDLARLAALDDAGFRALFAGSPVKRIGRDRFLRNVLIAIGNSGSQALVSSARDRLTDASPLVRGAAIWALSRLLPKPDFVTISASAAPDSDPAVVEEWVQATLP